MEIVIAKHYCGPSDSGNGGYTAGLFAKQLPFAAEVTLRIPPPLDQPLTVKINDNSAQLLDGETLVAEAKERALAIAEVKLPNLPTLAEATASSKNYLGFSAAPFHNCFVCGASRKPGEGLNIYAGPVAEKQVAAPWIPTTNLSSDGQFIDTEYVWSALDCPGAWSVINSSEVIVLGRFAVTMLEQLPLHQKYIACGWSIDRDGRKIYTGTSISDDNGKIYAFAKGIWIALKQ